MRISDETYKIMMKQITLDCNLDEASEIADNMYIAPSKKIEGARIIEGMDLFLKVIVFMGKAYIMVDQEVLPGFADFFKDIKPEWMFEFFTLRKIDYILQNYGRSIVDTHIYFLPDEDAPKVHEKGNEIWLEKEDILALKDNNPFHNAFGYSLTQPDIIGVGIKENNSFVAMAGASNDGKYLKQIGVDVLKKYCGKGYATHLVSLTKQKILEDGFIPFYGTNESHSISRSVAIKSGFAPAFSEFFVSRKTGNSFKETNRIFE